MNSKNKEKNLNKSTKKSYLEKKHKILRKKNSLASVTEKFILYTKKIKENTINLNQVAKALKINKRRLYDIINVLEGMQKYIILLIITFIGIGYLKKAGTNKIKIVKDLSIVEIGQNKENSIIDIKNNHDNIINSINCEIKFINTLITKIEDIFNT